jgi:hypothetical protein
MTQRDMWTLIAVAPVPAALAAIGHALQWDGPALTVLVCVAWVGVVAAVARVEWWSR